MPLPLDSIHILAAAVLEQSQVTRLLLAMAVLLGSARMLVEFSRKFGQPPLLGEGAGPGATASSSPSRSRSCSSA